MITFVLNLEIHYEVVSPPWFHYRAIFGSSTSATRLNLFFGCFLDGSHVFKEPAGIVYHAFEAFSRDCISLELEMISFLKYLSFRITRLTHLLNCYHRC